MTIGAARLSCDEVEAITIAVDRALAVAGKRRTVSLDLFFQLLHLRDAPTSALPELLALRDLLLGMESLALFRNATQCTLGHSRRLSTEFLPGWLIGRAQQTSAREAVTDLDNFLGCATLEVAEVLAVDGPDPTDAIQFGDYQLVPWRALPDSDAKWDAVASNLGAIPIPTAAVVRRHEIPSTHRFPWAPAPYEPSATLDPALDILRCVSAVTRSGYRLLHYWIEADPCMPWDLNRQSFGFDGRSLLRGASIAPRAAGEIQQTVAALATRTSADRDHLLVALDRFNLACATNHPVDRAIELGIALECVFAPKKLSEGISAMVRVRAARFLGGNADERRKTFETIKVLYALRSQVMHAGRFGAEESDKRWRDMAKVEQALEAGQVVVQRALLKVISDGPPDWEAHDLLG